VTDGEWLHFDDKIVREWSLDRLDEDCYGGSFQQGSGQQQQQQQQQGERPNSAYMLFYERKDSACFERSDIKMHVGGPHLQQSCFMSNMMQQQQHVQQLSSSNNSEVSMERSGPDEGYREEASASVSVKDTSTLLTPYGMPPDMYLQVLKEGLRMNFILHIGSHQYQGFIRSIVERRSEAESESEGGQRARKSRRRQTTGEAEEAQLALVLDHGRAGSESLRNAHGQVTELVESHHGSYATGPEFISTLPSGSATTTAIVTTATVDAYIGPNPSPTLSPSPCASSPASAATGASLFQLRPSVSHREQDLNVAIVQSTHLTVIYIVTVLLGAYSLTHTDLQAWLSIIDSLTQRSRDACLTVFESMHEVASCLKTHFQNQGTSMVMFMLENMIKTAMR
jgi:hypothetical protein